MRVFLRYCLQMTMDICRVVCMFIWRAHVKLHIHVHTDMSSPLFLLLSSACLAIHISVYTHVGQFALIILIVMCFNNRRLGLLSTRVVKQLHSLVNHPY